MKLTEVLAPSKLIKRAILDGVETVEEYNKWFSGYMIGYEEARKDALEVVSNDISFLTDTDWQPSSVIHYTNKKAKDERIT